MSEATRAPANLRIFGAFATVLGAQDSLQSQSTWELPDGALAMVRANSTLYQFDRGSTTAPSATVVQPAAGPGRWLALAGALGIISSDNVTNESGVPGTNVTEALDNLEAQMTPFVIRDLVPADDNTPTIQAYVDAVDPFTFLEIQQQGGFRLASPIRLETQIGLGGLSNATQLNKDPFWFAGSSIIVGPIQTPFPHGAAILDDADFSYSFTGADVATYMPIGLPTAGGVFPQDWPGLWLEMAITVTGPVVSPATLFTIHGENLTNIFSTSMVLDASWKFTNDVLLVTVFTDLAGVQLESTTDFSGEIGVRHMIAIGWDDPTQMAYLFVDGVLEDSAALAGNVFTSQPWQMANIGGARVQFGESAWIQSADFDLGSFYIGDVCKHTANYAVSWDVPASGVDTRCMVVCQNDREVDDLVKLTSGTIAYSWMRYPTSAGQGSDVQVKNLLFGTGGVAGGCSVQVETSLRTVVSSITSNEAAVVCNGNSFYSTFENITQTGGQRFGSLFSGGLCNWNGINKFSGAAIGVAFINGGGAAETIHTYDYTRIGFWFDGWSGSGTFGASDESTPPGVDPLYGVYWRAPDGLASVTEINLTVDVISSDSTIPFNVARNRNSILKINGGQSFLAGLTTPPSSFFLFTTPTLDDPIYADIITLDPVPIANLPEKVITSSGPAGALTLTAAASTTITTRQALEFNYTGVTLVGPTALVLSNNVGDGPEPRDGTTITVNANPTFDGNTLEVQNFDATPLASFTAAGWMKFRWRSSASSWQAMYGA